MLTLLNPGDVVGEAENLTNLIGNPTALLEHLRVTSGVIRWTFLQLTTRYLMTPNVLQDEREQGEGTSNADR